MHSLTAAVVLLAWALPAGAAALEQAAVVDLAEPHRDDRPVALVLLTPGLDAATAAPLARALERQGLDAWQLALPPAAQQVHAVVSRTLPAAVSSFPGRVVVVVGEGLGGTLAARWVAEGGRPAGLVLIGVPLAPPRSALTDWLLDQPSRQEALDLTSHVDSTWRDRPVLELLLGAPLPPLDSVGPAWLADLADWYRTGTAVDLSATPVPTWAAGASLDNLAPPEGTRPFLPPGTWHRFGPLRFDAHGLDHTGLLASPRVRGKAAEAAARLARVEPQEQP